MDRADRAGRCTVSVRIDRSTASLVPSVAAAILALETAQEIRPLGAAALLEEAARDDGVLLVASQDEQVVGFASARSIAGDVHVLRITVAPPHRRQGIGTLLLSGLLDWAGERAASSVVLEVRAGDPVAQQLYTRAGFVRDGLRRRYYPDGEDALLLRRTDLGRTPVARQGPTADGRG